MDPRLRMSVEIETLHELLPDLNYYRLLKLEPGCTQDAVGTAFRAESRRLHPDRMAAVGGAEVRQKANDVFRIVNEAYRVLKDPESRLRYDGLMAAGILRMTDDAQALAQADKHSNDPEHAARDPKAEKYWKLALRDWTDKKYRSCVMNIKFAMNFEPDNETFKEYLAKAEEAENDAAKKRGLNPYKLRIV